MPAAAFPAVAAPDMQDIQDTPDMQRDMPGIRAGTGTGVAHIHVHNAVAAVVAAAAAVAVAIGVGVVTYVYRSIRNRE
jgi:hypothetical protein